MDRELTYQVPFDRLMKVGRSLRRQAFPAVWVFARMSVEAQKRSQKNIAALLQQAGQA